MSEAAKTVRKIGRDVSKAGSAMLMHAAALDGLRKTLPGEASAVAAGELGLSAREARRLADDLARVGRRIAAVARALEGTGRGRRP